MLGGCLADGSCAVNELTYMSLTASREIRQIDPKINLRVDKNTPDELYEAAMLRLENPDLSLSALCKLSKIPITRSGLNHRIKKLIDLSKEIE